MGRLTVRRPEQSAMAEVEDSSAEAATLDPDGCQEWILNEPLDSISGLRSILKGERHLVATAAAEREGGHQKRENSVDA